MPMPSFPIYVLMENRMKPLLTGKIIAEITCEKIYSGRYSWHGEALKNVDCIKNTKIIYADSNYILTEDSHIIEFGYFDGDIRYYGNPADIAVKPIKKSVTDGYLVTFLFSDGSCMALTLYSWCTRFGIRPIDHPFGGIIPKSPIELTDPAVFTLENFKQWLSGRGGMNIVENCSTAKGAFDVYNPVMSYILLISRIHPRTKTRCLSDSEIAGLFNHTKDITADYQTGRRICGHTDIDGNRIAPSNDVIWMDSKMMGKPCPVCGAAIESTPCAGTKMYFCPVCQKKA